MPSANMARATSTTIRAGVHQLAPVSARRPAGPPSHSLPAAETGSSAVGRTGSPAVVYRASESGARVMRHILPYAAAGADPRSGPGVPGPCSGPGTAEGPAGVCVS
ncbi:hypothetical protein [Streptomyces meridianus]|uniref:Uncharacterized protein n=1 Tax=Streptomyces meridianus TaxID=2938945 RepID=A0ABT0X7V7_9ACTN|nr:hypothetical protein [Streptomyces meridianus]